MPRPAADTISLPSRPGRAPSGSTPSGRPGQGAHRSGGTVIRAGRGEDQGGVAVEETCGPQGEPRVLHRHHLKVKAPAEMWTADHVPHGDAGVVDWPVRRGPGGQPGASRM